MFDDWNKDDRSVLANCVGVLTINLSFPKSWQDLCKGSYLRQTWNMPFIKFYRNQTIIKQFDQKSSVSTVLLRLASVKGESSMPIGSDKKSCKDVPTRPRRIFALRNIFTSWEWVTTLTEKNTGIIRNRVSWPNRRYFSNQNWKKPIHSKVIYAVATNLDKLSYRFLVEESLNSRIRRMKEWPQRDSFVL